jgi:REP element-mobilizing transposase RayT
MAYTLRDESPGTRHITCRGNNKRPIFLVERDAHDFLRRVTRTSLRHGWTIHAYCLMPNHYHLIIEIGERGMSGGFCELNTGYACAFNQRHGRSNHLFGRRYWSGTLETDASFLAATRYTLLNPVRGGLVRDPAEWRWSSYRATVGLARPDLPLARRPLLARFSRNPHKAAGLFRAYVRDGPG